jgi:hypothetical protein
MHPQDCGAKKRGFFQRGKDRRKCDCKRMTAGCMRSACSGWLTIGIEEAPPCLAGFWSIRPASIKKIFVSSVFRGEKQARRIVERWSVLPFSFLELDCADAPPTAGLHPKCEKNTCEIRQICRADQKCVYHLRGRPGPAGREGRRIASQVSRNAWILCKQTCIHIEAGETRSEAKIQEYFKIICLVFTFLTSSIL